MIQQILSLQEAADLLGRHPNSVRRYRGDRLRSANNQAWRPA